MEKKEGVLIEACEGTGSSKDVLLRVGVILLSLCSLFASTLGHESEKSKKNTGPKTVLKIPETYYEEG